MGYVMKWRYIVIGVVLLLSACTLPVSAIDSLEVEIVELEYPIIPMVVEELIEPASSISSSIMQGQTRYLNHYVAPDSTRMDIELSWTLPPNYNSLKLKVINPRGLTVSEFDDTYESQIPNGSIILLLEYDNLPGLWRIEVFGESVTGLQSFDLIVNSY